MPANSAAMHLVQQVRDEAHRFAIAGHRAQRGKAQTKSILQEVPGIGAKRRQVLLKHFGGLQGIRDAGIKDLQKVDGINEDLAQKIYHYLKQWLSYGFVTKVCINVSPKHKTVMLPKVF